MTVGNEALRPHKRPLHDVIRGPSARRCARQSAGCWLFVDANCSRSLSRDPACRDGQALGISFFEEPLTQNDAPDGRLRPPGVRSPAGRRGAAVSFCDLLLASRLKCCSQTLHQRRHHAMPQVAGLAAAFNVIDNGGAWPFLCAACGLERRHGRAPLSRGGAVPKNVSRPARAEGRLAHLPETRARFRAGLRDPRDRQAPVVAATPG